MKFFTLKEQIVEFNTEQYITGHFRDKSFQSITNKLRFKMRFQDPDQDQDIEVQDKNQDQDCMFQDYRSNVLPSEMHFLSHIVKS